MEKELLDEIAEKDKLILKLKLQLEEQEIDERGREFEGIENNYNYTNVRPRDDDYGQVKRGLN